VRSSGWPRGPALAAFAFAAFVVAAGACSKPQSYIILDLRSADTRQISPVTEVVVHVTQMPNLDKTLTYPAKKGALVINQTNLNDLSVSFTGGRSGPVMLDIDVFDGTGCDVGSAHGASVTIRQGDVVTVGVDLNAQTCGTADGGVDGGPEGDAFPGCDPAAPGQTCMPTETCQVNCMKSVGECTPGGKGGPGAACLKNVDCAPGLQCFDYSGTGCGVKICLRFCNDDNACGSGSPDGGASDAGGAEGGASSSSGTRSVCEGLVPCNGMNTAYHTCTFGCDPRQTAAAAHSTGCPAGLACLVVGGMDQVDCACAEASRKGTDGVDCGGGADCAPGYICNMMGSTKKCRAICRCDAKNGACTAANECGNKLCSALTNETTFGVCL
jgi:hypothetical protein